MNRPIAILFFAIFFFSQVGYFFIYTIGIFHHDGERVDALFNSLSEKQCEIVNLSQKKIFWEKEGTDFVLDGEDYDVVKEKVIDGKVYLFCITDKKESELLEDMSLKFATDHNIGKDFNLVFGDDCILNHYNIVPFQFPSIKKYPSYSDATADAVTNIVLPPPQLFS